MTSTLTPSTRRATFAIGNEQTAKRVVDLLTESFFEGQAAIAAFERPGDGRWDITVHFAEPPDEASIRELVGIAERKVRLEHNQFNLRLGTVWLKFHIALVLIMAVEIVFHITGALYFAGI